MSYQAESSQITYYGNSPGTVPFPACQPARPVSIPTATSATPPNGITPEPTAVISTHTAQVEVADQVEPTDTPDGLFARRYSICFVLPLSTSAPHPCSAQSSRPGRYKTACHLTVRVFCRFLGSALVNLVLQIPHPAIQITRSNSACLADQRRGFLQVGKCKPLCKARVQIAQATARFRQLSASPRPGAAAGAPGSWRPAAARPGRPFPAQAA